jgi:hypothetical protein
MLQQALVQFRSIAIVCLGLLCGGCSYLFVNGPSPGPGGADHCTTSNGWPAFDMVYGTVNTGADIWAATKSGPYQGVYAVGAIGSALLWGSSAITGFSRTSKCREAKGLEPDGVEPYAPPPYGSSAPGGGQGFSSSPQPTHQCPAGMQEKGGGHCCWPGQRFAAESAQCIGAPICPTGTVASGASCKPLEAGCPAGMQRKDSQHCCWPGQAFVPEKAECVGVPTCPEGMMASGASCTAAASDQK